MARAVFQNILFVADVELVVIDATIIRRAVIDLHIIFLEATSLHFTTI
jgi:hypothetical protein